MLQPGEAATLDGSGSRDADGSIVSYVWTYNGNEVGTDETAVLSGLGAGVHTISLLVTDNAGATDTDSVDVTVSSVALIATDDTGTVTSGSSVAIDVLLALVCRTSRRLL